MTQSNQQMTGAERLADMIRFYKGNVVVLTGAGMSTESGLPDFRSSGGLWDGKDPMKICTVKAMEKDPSTFTSFYRHRIFERDQYQPNIGHHLLSDWQKQGWIKRVITQNVDGYHAKAGSHDVIELHGTLSTVRCQKCGLQRDSWSYREFSADCDHCDGLLRPNIVLFGEDLPVAALEEAKDLAKECKLFIVLGTSLQVYPAASLPDMADRRGAKVAIVDRKKFPTNYFFIEGSIGNTLHEADYYLNPENYGDMKPSCMTT